MDCKRKTMRILSLMTAMILLFLSVCGCSNSEVSSSSPKNQPESEVTADMERSIRLIRKAGDLDLDSAQGTVETLLELGINFLKDAKLVSNDHGVVLQIVDEKDNTYYLGYGGLGYLEIIRKDSLNGEIIYAPME